MKILIAFTVCCFTLSNALAGQDVTSEKLPERDSGMDAAWSVEHQVVIEAIDLNAMTIQIDGKVYRLPENNSREFADRIEVRLSDLRPGSEVFIQSDGTVPSADHRPFIVRIWKE